MPLEIELKMRVTDFDALEKKLQSLGAGRVARIAEENIFLDTPDLALRKSDSGLRVRVEHDRDTNQLRSIIITHKGPRQPGPVKSRTETELHAASDTQAIALLNALGYHETLRFEKHRDRWSLDGCHIELDTLPMLGRFVEIEGPGEEAIQQLRTKLGLDHLPLEPAGYASLLGRELEAQGSVSRQVRF